MWSLEIDVGGGGNRNKPQPTDIHTCRGPNTKRDAFVAANNFYVDP